MPGEVYHWSVQAIDHTFAGSEFAATGSIVLPESRSWHVPTEVPSVQAGIDSAVWGDTVLVAAGTYAEYDIIMKSGVQLKGEIGGSEQVTIDAQGLGRGIYCDGVDQMTSIEGLVITGGLASDGAGLYCTGGSIPLIANCTFFQNSSDSGGGSVACWGNSSPILENCLIAFSTEGAGLSCGSGGSATLSCCDIWGNPGGDWTACISDQIHSDGNLWADPRFCDPGSGGDLRLDPDSPCAPFSTPNPECDLIGACRVGCEATSEWVGIQTIADIPGDQGGEVRVTWTAHGNDTPGASAPVTEYSLWRRIDERYPPGDWEYILTVPALEEEEYTAVSPTLCDSTITEGQCWSVFFAIAHTDDPGTFFESIPDSGYSVDNLAPSAPESFHYDSPALLAWAGESGGRLQLLHRLRLGQGAGAEDVETGVYFYRLEAGEFTQTRKMLIAR